MIKLLKNANVYAPEKLGKKDILVEEENALTKRQLTELLCGDRETQSMADESGGPVDDGCRNHLRNQASLSENQIPDLP